MLTELFFCSLRGACPFLTSLDNCTGEPPASIAGDGDACVAAGAGNTRRVETRVVSARVCGHVASAGDGSSSSPTLPGSGAVVGSIAAAGRCCCRTPPSLHARAPRRARRRAQHLPCRGSATAAIHRPVSLAATHLPWPWWRRRVRCFNDSVFFCTRGSTPISGIFGYPREQLYSRVQTQAKFTTQELREFERQRQPE
jgi:hypothetical protein